MITNMRLADHSGTFCSRLSGCVQIRGLKEEGDFHHDERQIKKQKSTDSVSLSPGAEFATHTHTLTQIARRASTANEDVPNFNSLTKFSK